MLKDNMCRKTIFSFVLCGHWESLLEACDNAVKRGFDEFQSHALCQPIIEVRKNVNGWCKICEALRLE